MIAAVLVAICSLIIFITNKLLIYARHRKIINQIPGPRNYFLLGNALMFEKDVTAFFEQFTGVGIMFSKPRMPRLFRCWIGPEPLVMVYGAEEAEVILSSNKHINKSVYYDFLKPWLGLGLLTSSAQIWRPHRKLLTPTFHYDILKEFVEVFNDQSKVLVKILSEKASQGSLNICTYTNLCALDIICETSMGRHVNAQRDSTSAYVRVVKRINEIIHLRQIKPWWWNNYLFHLIGPGKEFDEGVKTLHAFSRKVITEQQKVHAAAGGIENLIKKSSNGLKNGESIGTPSEGTKGKCRMAFLDLLLDIMAKGQLTLQELYDQVDTFMFEGHDTTTAGMNWSLFLLAQHPDIQANVQQEIDEILGEEDRYITFEDLKDMHLLERCIKEAMRIYPPVPLYARTLEEDTIIGGCRLVKGLTVIINPYLVHRDPKHWPNAEHFQPDRFLSENLAGRHPYAYLPFSAGARNCIGQRFAMMEEKTVIAWVLRYFDIKAVHRRDQIRPKGDLILRPTEGIYLELNLRRSIANLDEILSESK